MLKILLRLCLLASLQSAPAADTKVIAVVDTLKKQSANGRGEYNDLTLTISSYDAYGDADHTRYLDMGLGSPKPITDVKYERVRDANGYVLRLTSRNVLMDSEIESEETYLNDLLGRKVRIISTAWDPFDAKLVNQMKDSTVYDGQNRIVAEYRWYPSASGVWEIAYMDRYQFDAIGGWVRIWESGPAFGGPNSHADSLTRLRSTVKVNAAGKTISVLKEIWNGPGNSWDPILRDTTLYNAAGLDTAKYDYVWNVEKQAWLIDRRTRFAYDGNGLPIMNAKEFWKAERNAWVSYDSSSFARDGQGRIIAQEGWHWDSAGSKWSGWYKETVTYDIRGLESTRLHWVWSGSGWDEDTRDVYVYNDIRVNVGVKPPRLSLAHARFSPGQTVEAVGADGRVLQRFVYQGPEGLEAIRSKSRGWFALRLQVKQEPER